MVLLFYRCLDASWVGGVDLDVVDPVSPRRSKKVSKTRTPFGKRLEVLDAQMQNQPHESSLILLGAECRAATKRSVPEYSN